MSVFLICEFDPLHYGHKYIISEAKRRFSGEPLVCVMSGNFVQRGNPAIYDKYARAKAAALSGADLVLSLPFPWCSGSAEYFARGAVSVISGLCKSGDTLIFGSECADAELLQKTAENLASPGFASALSDAVSLHNEPYAAARQRLYEKTYGQSEILSGNDILAVEYIKAINAADAPLGICPVKRDPTCRSSSEIRASADPLSLTPPQMQKSAGSSADMERFGRAALYHFRTLEDFSTAEGNFGVLERIRAASGRSGTFSEMMRRAASSAFTDAKLRRAALFSLLRIKDGDLKQDPVYTLLLAANKAGTDLLSSYRKAGGISVLTKPADSSELPDAARRQFEFERRADELYCMLTDTVLPCGAFMKKTPFILKEE